MYVLAVSSYVKSIVPHVSTGSWFAWTVGSFNLMLGTEVCLARTL